MKIENRFYNEDSMRSRAIENLDIIDKGEAVSWKQHPCTKALMLAIQADMTGIINMWLAGAYGSEESVDVTAQRQAKARGMAQAMDDILETIDQIGNNSLKEDDDSIQ